MMQENQNLQGQATITNQTKKNSNGIGIAGFVLAIIAIILGWIPVLGWILWLLGLIFSFIGVFKEPRGLSIAGLAISIVGLILMIAVFGAIMVGLAALQ